ncbi:MAG: hypothetical protein CMM77_07035 [Rhodospirillaceae bacterium]|nr:hypothetical protein [Magnetovibrio sp.]MAY66865.1 hypothetical protein [Rhodospirillaceae bacterium]
MRVFTVHLRRHGLDPDKDVRVVKEGFSWPAFLFTFLWALWHRMWWTALGLFVIVTVAGIAVEALLPHPVAGTAAMLALYVAIGFVGNDLLRRHLAALGFAETGPVCGEDRDHALYRFLDADPVLARDLAAART